MGETQFPPAAAIPQAEARHVGSGWNTGNLADRADANSHLPLGGALPPGTIGALVVHEPAPPPPAPSEEELRQRLADAITKQTDMAAAMEAARCAHERGLQHANRCQTAVARYVGLDDEIDRHTVDQLRGAEGKAQLSDALRARVVERDLAAIELASAERATTLLLRELSDCIERNKQAEAAVTQATDLLLHIGQDKLREPLNVLRRRVAAFEQAIGASRSFELLQPIVAALHHDPLNAPLDIEVPSEPLPSVVIPSWPTVGPVLVTTARPLNAPDDWQPVTLPLEEMTRLQRTQTKPGNDAVAAFEATERAARLARGI